MDELLEGAAAELVRSRGPSQRMLPDGHEGGETSRASRGAQQLLTQGESSQSEAETGVGGDATKDKETRSEEKEGVTAGVADMETETASAELYKVICQELAEYRRVVVLSWCIAVGVGLATPLHFCFLFASGQAHPCWISSRLDNSEVDVRGFLPYVCVNQADRLSC